VRRGARFASAAAWSARQASRLVPGTFTRRISRHSCPRRASHEVDFVHGAGCAPLQLHGCCGSDHSANERKALTRGGRPAGSGASSEGAADHRRDQGNRQLQVGYVDSKIGGRALGAPAPSSRTDGWLLRRTAFSTLKTQSTETLQESWGHALCCSPVLYALQRPGPR
jgi:hypothetical protein